MRRWLIATVMTATALGGLSTAHASHQQAFGMEVLLDGAPRPEYSGRGAIYVEAVRGREYTLRLTNPLPVRVAVALSVDGLNTIDARRSDVAHAAKWVLAPYETVEISGWQVSGQEARAFYFTGERSSYGAWLGETDNLGVIEAVFFREKLRPLPIVHGQRQYGRERGSAGGAGKDSASSAPTAPARPQAESVDGSLLADDYAATGIGDRRRHEVQWVDLELERDPAATVRIRYEFRPQLVKLGLLPELPWRSPLDRREAARGFSGRYCPEPPVR